MPSIFYGRQKPRPTHAVRVTQSAESRTDGRTAPEFYFIAAGAGKLRAGRDTFPLRSGDLVLVNRDAPVAAGIESAAAVCYAMSVDPLRVPDGNILKSGAFLIVPTGEYADAFTGLFEQIVREYDARRPFGGPILEHLTQTFLLYVLRLAESDLNLSFGKADMFEEAKAYFDEHFTDISGLEEACEYLGVSKFSLTHQFRARAGIPPIRYITNKRMALAEKLLATTALEVGEVAVRCGYADAPYFCRVFKAQHDMTPLQFRYAKKSRSF